MSFWLRDTRCIYFLKRLSTIKRVAFTLSVLSVGSGLWFYFIYWPLRIDFQRERSMLLELTERVKKMKKDESWSRQRLCSKKLEQEYHQLVARYGNVQDTVDFIFSSLKKFRLTCKNLQPMNQKKHQKTLYSSDFKLCVQGNFKKILLFLMTLQESDYLVSFENFSLTRDKKRKIIFNALIRIPRISS